MDINVVYDLMQAVNKYYPVGLPDLASDYPGRRMWIDKLEGKFSETSATSIRWTALTKALNKYYGTEAVEDMLYRQFPGFTAYIKLMEKDADGFRQTRHLVLNISLLSDVYTVFCEDKFYVEAVAKQANETYTEPFILLSAKSNSNFQPDLSNVKDLVTEHFPDHSFLAHKYLFFYKIQACTPYSTEYSPHLSYNIYDYLMNDCYYQQDNVRVIH